VGTVLFRILLVDDFAAWRQVVISMLAMKSELQVVGEASDGLEAVQKAAELKPDLILLDIGLPTLSGIEAARQIRKLVPKCKIIFLSQESSSEIIEEAMNVGASGYVVKAKAGSDLLTAVESVLLGGTFVSD
jgi:DNA-binding NarL/FixJ family response regulator